MLHFYQGIDPYYALNLKMAVVVNPQCNSKWYALQKGKNPLQ
jgi:hypothetical protein